MGGEDAIKTFKRIGIVGAGNMGTMMTFGFAEQGLDVSLWDIKSENVDQAMEMAKNVKTLKGKVNGYHDIHEFVRSLDGNERKLFLFSITHGPPADSVLDKIKDQLKDGDIILDGGNEHYRNTERRQRELAPRGVSWIGMGVSGGYQSARLGPSMSPGGDKKALDAVLPILEKFSAKDAKTGNPCVANIGPRGSGKCLLESFQSHHVLGVAYDDDQRGRQRYRDAMSNYKQVTMLRWSTTESKTVCCQQCAKPGAC